MVVNITAQPYIRRDLQAKPVSHIKDAWPKLGNHSFKFQQSPQTKTSDVIEKWFLKLLDAMLGLVGIDSTTVQNLFGSLLSVASDAIKCDFYAVQTCSRWHVKLIHGLIISGVYLSFWIVFWNSIRLPLVAALSLALYGAIVMYICYGYSPLCFPMVPICWLEDVIQTLRFFFPKFLYLPSTMIVVGRPECTANTLYPRFDCLKSCESEPLEFDGWKPVFAWGVVELGGVVESFVYDNIHLIPLADYTGIRQLINEKKLVLTRGNDDMLSAQRFCAVLNVYRLAPYAVVMLLIISSSVALANLVPLLINPVLQILTQLYVAIFVE